MVALTKLDQAKPNFGMPRGLRPFSPGALVFIDSNLPDLPWLIACLPSGTEVHPIDGSGNGLKQIADLLAERQDLTAIHLFFHGAPGQLFIGNTTLELNSLKQYAESICTIAAALDEDGEILIYGCDVGAGEVGRQFIAGLANVTGLQVTATAQPI